MLQTATSTLAVRNLGADPWPARINTGVAQEQKNQLAKPFNDIEGLSEVSTAGRRGEMVKAEARRLTAHPAGF